ncbi:MAG: hypothetical protein V7752_08130 [Halopseudomonas sp.]
MAYSSTANQCEADQDIRSQKDLELNELSSELLDFIHGRRGIRPSVQSDEFTLEVIRLWLMAYQSDLCKKRLAN